MKQGDFTNLAKDYIYRTGYSQNVLNYIFDHLKSTNGSEIKVAEIGAGTGKLTEQLIEMGLNGNAVEPNDSMRSEGIKICGNTRFNWSKGTGEATGLDNLAYNWAIMASSFHWTNPKESLPEFHRILKPNGLLSVLWNPRDKENNQLQSKIDENIQRMIPGLKRVSSGSKEYTKDLDKILISTNHFKEVIFLEATHVVEMTKERYLGAWRSVNDIQAQAGKELFEDIIKMITEEISLLDSVSVTYKTRCWTAKVIK